MRGPRKRALGNGPILALLEVYAEGLTDRVATGVDAGTWAAMWADLVVLMRSGVRMGRIVTTCPEHRNRRSGAVRREDAHYVYRRTGLPCRVCGTPVQTEVMAGRNLYWCPVCQDT